MVKERKITFKTTLGRMEFELVDFLKAVAERPLLYDPQMFGNLPNINRKKDAAWTEIAFQLVPKLEKLDAKELSAVVDNMFRYNWSKMKTALRGRLRLVKEGKTKSKPYMFEKEMEFYIKSDPQLAEMYYNCKTDKSVSSPEEDDEETPRKRKQPEITIKEEILNESFSAEATKRSRISKEISASNAPPRSDRLKQTNLLATSSPKEGRKISKISTEIQNSNTPPRSDRLKQRSLLVSSSPKEGTKLSTKISKEISKNHTSPPTDRSRLRSLFPGTSPASNLKKTPKNTNSPPSNGQEAEEVIKEITSADTEKGQKLNTLNSSLHQRKSTRTSTCTKYQEKEGRTSVGHVSETFSKSSTPSSSEDDSEGSIRRSSTATNSKQILEQNTSNVNNPKGRQLDISAINPMDYCESIENVSAIQECVDNSAEQSTIHKATTNNRIPQQVVYGIHDAAERAFFESLLPIVYKIGKARKLDFKIEVLQLLKKYQK
uniref:MADF domain-containing protein n=1 Tax=Stomoxys calcitrans TaxID=35570 RepID=A0A1I8PUH5_STOCA